MTTVQELQGEEYILVSQDSEVEELNQEYDEDYGCYLVKMGDGELTEVWGIESSIPWLENTAYQVK